MILASSRAGRVYAYPEPVDLRNGYDGLFGLVKQGLGRDPMSGDLFLARAAWRLDRPEGKRRTGRNDDRTRFGALIPSRLCVSRESGKRP